MEGNGLVREAVARAQIRKEPSVCRGVRSMGVNGLRGMSTWRIGMAAELRAIRLETRLVRA